MTTPAYPERHYSHRVGWLRAAVLGANDGIVSTASLVVGVAAANTSRHGVLVAGVAGLVAGAMSMAAGEYVSVSSQRDTEEADLARERRELRNMPDVVVSATSLVFLAALGALSAGAGGARITRGVVRVTFWGAFAMALTAVVGRLFGAAV
jgi:VIT1/CCC1 family predicted Fe2+/Mn2+ transporter